MYASIGHYADMGAATDDVIQRAWQLAVALSTATGFVSYALLDTGNGALTSITVFESRTELEAGNDLIGAWMAEHLPNRQQTPMWLEIGEIVQQRGM